MSIVHTFSTTQPQRRDEVSEGNKLKRTRVTYIFSHDPKGPEELTLGLKRMFYLSLVRCLKENGSLSDRVKFQFCHLNHVLSYIPTTLIAVSGWGNKTSFTFKAFFTSSLNRVQSYITGVSWSFGSFYF